VHGTWPKANADWWRAKIDANKQRDLDTNRKLQTLAWRVIRVWEHEDMIEAAARICAAVSSAEDRRAKGC
jgi:DNA mismatch endonuclease (patch repair protein)